MFVEATWQTPVRSDCKSESEEGDRWDDGGGNRTRELGRGYDVRREDKNVFVLPVPTVDLCQTPLEANPSAKLFFRFLLWGLGTLLNGDFPKIPSEKLCSVLERQAVECRSSHLGLGKRSRPHFHVTLHK